MGDTKSVKHIVFGVQARRLQRLNQMEYHSPDEDFLSNHVAERQMLFANTTLNQPIKVVRVCISVAVRDFSARIVFRYVTKKMTPNSAWEYLSHYFSACQGRCEQISSCSVEPDINKLSEFFIIMQFHIAHFLHYYNRLVAVCLKINSQNEIQNLNRKL